MDNSYDLYKQMYRIRSFEELLLSLFKKGLLHGTIHVYIGQEANAVGVLCNAKPDDLVFSSHRCHGHYLAHKGDMLALFNEILGKPSGLCAGKGGSQHICNGSFFSSGIQGGYMPVAVGMAYAEKIKKTDKIVIAFIGDGTLGQGTVYESFNMASLYSVPLLVVIENNRYAQSTPIEKNLAGSIRKRAEAFNISCDEMESYDVDEIKTKYSEIIPIVRKEKKPFVGIIHTHRLCPHSTSDDSRPKEYLDHIKDFDPLKISLKKSGKDIFEKIHKEVKAEIEDLILRSEIQL